MALNLTRAAAAQNVSLAQRNFPPFLCCGIINKKILSSRVIRSGSVYTLKKANALRGSGKILLGKHTHTHVRC